MQVVISGSNRGLGLAVGRDLLGARGDGSGIGGYILEASTNATNLDAVYAATAVVCVLGLGPADAGVRSTLHDELRYESLDAGLSHPASHVALMQRPDGMQRLYFYEPERQAGNRHALTGIATAMEWSCSMT